MSDIDRRLHHAGRELREISIEPPPFESLVPAVRRAPRSSRMSVLIMPLLFVLGGAVVVAGGITDHDVVTVPEAAAPVSAGPAPARIAETVASDDPGATAEVPTVRPHVGLSIEDELRLISQLSSGRRADPAPIGPTGSTELRRYR